MLIEPFSQRITETFKTLLETKHLYQSITMPIDDLKAKLPKTWINPAPQVAWAEFLIIARAVWHPTTPTTSKRELFPTAQGRVETTFDLPDVKLHCIKCDRTEAYNAIEAQDMISGLRFNPGIREGREIAVQQFALSFQCQSCKMEPEVFLARRVGFKLTLCGRSPIEAVAVPGVIPKAVSSFFSNALVSHHSGFTLAGIFYLRTLIEQYVYSLNKSCKDVAGTLDWYMDQLPKDFKERFRSFRELYEVLSADIHSAGGSPELFESSVASIVEHFEARKLFRLS